MDVNYRDSNKILLKMIMKGGSSVRRELLGIDMLIWQAIKQNALFCQQEDNKDENNLFDMVKKELGVWWGSKNHNSELFWNQIEAFPTLAKVPRN